MPEPAPPKPVRRTRAIWLGLFVVLALIAWTAVEILADRRPDAVVGGACLLAAAIVATLLTAVVMPARTRIQADSDEAATLGGRQRPSRATMRGRSRAM